MKRIVHEWGLVAVLIIGLYLMLSYAPSFLKSYYIFNEPTAEAIPNAVLTSSVEEGAKIFKTTCAACHGIKGQGASAPQNNDASLELLKAKVLTGAYPKGYKPKRNTKIMPKFPHLKDKIESIYKYLQTQR